MLIRCDRCSTLYELDEALLSPEGSPVQCTRCNHVFTARPSAQPGAGAPPPPAPDRFEPPPPDDHQDEALDQPPEPPVPAPSAPRYTAPPQRWDRSGPPVYRPGAASSAPGVSRPPQIRRDAVGAFEARLRRSARWRWLAPTLVVLVIVAIVAAWLLFSRRHGPVAARLRTEGLALIALDDAASLEQAVARFDEALRSAPGRREAEADRALAQVLAATALLEEGEARSARAAARIAERTAAVAAAVAAARPAAPGAAPPAAAAAAPPQSDPETVRLEAEARDRTARGTVLSRSALETLKRLGAERVAEPEVARALALLHAGAGEREALQRQVAAGRARAPDDPWLALAEATIDARARDRAGLERAVAALSALAVGHPELLRGRYLLAVGQARLGRRAEAQALAEGILAANSRHERAEALRAELARPLPASPPAAGAPAAAASPGPAAGNGAAPPRKAASQPAAAPVVAAPAARSEPAARSSTTPRAARAEAAAPTHPAAAGASPAGPDNAPSGAANAAPSGASAPPEQPPAVAPRLRPQAAPAVSPVEYGGGR